jgi:hypothetical protein
VNFTTKFTKEKRKEAQSLANAETLYTILQVPCGLCAHQHANPLRASWLNDWISTKFLLMAPAIPKISTFIIFL